MAIQLVRDYPLPATFIGGLVVGLMCSLLFLGFSLTSVNMFGIEFLSNESKQTLIQNITQCELQLSRSQEKAADQVDIQSQLLLMLMEKR